MDVHTKFEAGTKVFYINDNGKIADSTIKSVRVEQHAYDDGTVVTQTIYQLTAWRANARSRVNKTEDEIFGSVDELIASLTNDYNERSKNA